MLTEALPLLSSLAAPLLAPLVVVAGALRRCWHDAGLQDAIGGMDARTRRDIGLPPAPPEPPRFDSRMYL